MFAKRGRPLVEDHDGAKLWAEARALHDKGEDKKAFELYLRAANAGFARALNSVGVCYMTGFGLAKNKADPPKAVDFFEQGARQGDVSAMVNFANALAKGDGLERDEREAFAWYARAAERGDDDAQFLMAVALLEGRGTEKDPFRARSVFDALVTEKGYTKAYNYLGACYAHGIGGCRKDQQKAKELFEAAASKGDPRGMYNLAIVCQHGLGVEVDLNKSLQLHVKAWSECSHVDSLVMLGVFYSRGIAVLVDDARAFEIFTKAAKFGNVDALNYLGLCHLNGNGTTKDAKKAEEYFKQAADVGLVNLANLYLSGNGVEKDEQMACTLLQKATDLGNVDAMVCLAQCLAERDGPKALELLTRACEKRNARALFVRAQWLEEGVLLPKDLTSCLDFYRKAHLEGHKQAGERYRVLIMETLPDSVKRGGKKQIDRFVQDIMDSGNMAWNQAKVMVLGKEGVGKTALYHKIRGMPYATDLSTDGIDVHSFKLNSMELIWFDFGGQTIFIPPISFS